MPNGAVRNYVRNEFEARELEIRAKPRSLRPFYQGRVTISEVLRELLGRDYRYITTEFGFGLSLNGTAQLAEVSERFASKLRYLYIHKYSKPWLRPAEALDCSVLSRLSNLRGLSIGYLLDSHNASAIEDLASLQYLSLAWHVDETIKLEKLRCLRELSILSSPFLEDVWRLNRLEKLAVDHHRHTTLEVAANLTSVEKLTIGESATLKSLKGIGELPRLRFLALNGIGKLKSLTSISSATALEYLLIDKCSRLESVDELADVPNLKYLEIRDCPSLKSVVPFAGRSNLTHVFFMGRTRPDRPIEEIVKNLPKLQFYFGP